MAGSIDHIVDDGGEFRMELIENMGDATEALEDCFTALQEAVAYMPESLYPWGLRRSAAAALQRLRYKGTPPASSR